VRKKGTTKLPEPKNSGRTATDELALGGEGNVAVEEEGFFARQQENFDSSANGEVLLFTRGLKKVYDGRTVVNGVDIEVRRGEIVGLLGPNGAGKTTSFYMIVGLVQPNDGKVFFEGQDTTSEPMFKRARLGMGYLPQEESIFRKLTVRENILAVMETQNYTPEEREMQCQQLMEKFGIDHVADNLALTLSGGEKRRLTIARSLVTEPKLIMLDEPFSGVDPLAVEDIQKIILMLKSVGLAILITDHNVRETLGIVDRAYLIHEGRVLLHGTRDEIVNNPLARERYLGENFSM
jgi:lipopolysaccharide export system ATP-binding protein